MKVMTFIALDIISSSYDNSVLIKTAEMSLTFTAILIYAK